MNAEERSCHRQATPVHNDLTVDAEAEAEAVTALQALIVVKDFLIDLLAQRGPRDPASHTAKQSTEKSPGNTANGDPDWPADYSQHRADFCTRQGTGGAAGRTACRTN
jgi:hypothetical protein